MPTLRLIKVDGEFLTIFLWLTVAEPSRTTGFYGFPT